jgi:hypothetical protein
LALPKSHGTYLFAAPKPGQHFFCLITPSHPFPQKQGLSRQPQKLLAIAPLPINQKPKAWGGDERKRGKRKNSPVFNHTLNLLPHGQKHQDQPIHDQDGPEDGQVENLAPAAREAQGDGARRRVPEFKLGQAPHEGLEFLVVLGRERRGLARGHAVLHVRVGFEAGVEFGRDEGQEEVEEVDAEGVGDCFWEIEMLVFAIVRLIGLIRCRAMGGMPLLLLLLLPFLPFFSLAMYISMNGHAPTIASSPLPTLTSQEGILGVLETRKELRYICDHFYPNRKTNLNCIEKLQTIKKKLFVWPIRAYTNPK